MVRGRVVLDGIPHIQEVERLLEILRSIGVGVKWEGDRTLHIDTSGDLTLETIDRQACEQVRSSLLLLGALADRVKAYKLYTSGGCKLGERTVRPHLYVLEKFGVHVEVTSDYYDVKNRVDGGDRRVVMYESGDTPTENAIMVAVLTPGTTTITFASANYMVQDLCYFLCAAGAKIEGVGTTTLRITGVGALRKSVRYAIMPDPIEAMAFISLGVTTHSSLTITHCPIDFLELELEKLSVMGQQYKIQNERTTPNGNFRLVDIVLTPSSLRALPDKLYGRPYPGLNIDNVPMFIPLCTQAKGRSLIHDWVYENRAVYFMDLQRLGVNLVLLDPHRLFIEGPTRLQGAECICPPALRPGMAFLICMLAARGRSVLRNVYPIERGHEHLAERLRTIGANIDVVD